ncbi:MAG: LTA synthase family protein [Clostridium sp.]|nr:LTA synthase family protein [Prevotella sp.]MCM1429379.1 LTA synthase family protein [Clostridium sp.]MCM1475586.1 LTA synthase family protein [Muribaculaceae bacterium]
MINFKINTNIYWATLGQLSVALFFIWLSRWAFFFFNSASIGSLSFSSFFDISLWGLRFDLSAMIWLNIPFIAFRFLPFEFTSSQYAVRFSNIYFGVVNSLALCLNFIDTALVSFTGTRMRFDALSGWIGEGNMMSIFASYLGRYVPMIIVAVLFIISMLFLASRFNIKRGVPELSRPWKTYACRVAVFLIAGLSSFLGMRGVIKGHPLKISDALNAVDTMSQVSLVQNTPFCIIRTIGKGVDQLPEYNFYDETQLASIRSSVRGGVPADSAVLARGKNIMVIVMESGGALWGDSTYVYEADRPMSLMPFLDSIAGKSLRVENIFAAGKGTIDGLTTIFGGFPSVSPFMYMTSPYSDNNLDSPARLLSQMGYSTKFYLGSEKGSCNIDQFLRVSGFSEVTSRDDFPSKRDFDGAWGIYDHAVAGFAAEDLTNLQQPFFSGWLTLNPHMPFHVPDYWNADDYKSPPNSPERAAEYVDRSLREFFAVAARQPWFKNTVFIITSDHGSRDFKNTLQDSPWVQPHIFFMVYAPDGSIRPGVVNDRVMSQHDMAPTILAMAGYPREHVSLGMDIFSKTHAPYALSLIGDNVEVYSPSLMLMLKNDLSEIESVYDIKKDPTCSKPIMHQTAEQKAQVSKMMIWARAFMQDYSSRTRTRRMSVTPGRSSRKIN